MFFPRDPHEHGHERTCMDALIKRLIRHRHLIMSSCRSYLLQMAMPFVNDKTTNIDPTLKYKKSKRTLIQMELNVMSKQKTDHDLHISALSLAPFLCIFSVYL